MITATIKQKDKDIKPSDLMLILEEVTLWQLNKKGLGIHIELLIYVEQDSSLKGHKEIVIEDETRSIQLSK